MSVFDSDLKALGVKVNGLAKKLTPSAFKLISNIILFLYLLVAALGSFPNKLGCSSLQNVSYHELRPA